MNFVQFHEQNQKRNHLEPLNYYDLHTITIIIEIECFLSYVRILRKRSV